MLKRTVSSLAVLSALIGLVVVVDWQLSKGSVTTRDGATLIEDDRPRLLQSEAIAGVGFGGALSLSPDGCVGTVSPTGIFAPIIWQHGTSLAATDPLTVEFAGHTYRVGDVISAGGYEGSAAGEGYLDDIPKSCQADKYFYLRAD